MNFKLLFSAVTHAAPMIADHVWQSSWFALAIAALTVAFRKSQARIRFGLWLAASIKFLVPFSLLIGMGGMLGRPHFAVTAPPVIYSVIERAGQPFNGVGAAARPFAHATFPMSQLLAALAAVWLCGFVAVCAMWWARWRRVAKLVQVAQPLVEGREVNLLRQLERASGLRSPLPLLVSPASMEPGILGIVRPVLIWPQGISEHLPDPHLRSILAHELWHVLRRDNLVAAMHMLVEAAFWFHPAVWWVGTQLVEERERACDEKVLGLGNEPSIYAESILRACKFCIESPLPCLSGVAGSNLKRRITRIMNRQTGLKLTLAHKLLLTAAAVAAIAAPIAIGLLHASPAGAQEPQTAALAQVESDQVAFDQVTLKPSTATENNTHIDIEPNHFTQTNATLKSLIAFAYGMEEYQITGEPAWVDSDRFDIDATWKGPAHNVYNDMDVFARGVSSGSRLVVGNDAPLPPPPPPPGAMVKNLGRGQLQVMLQTLLAQRFHLQLSRQSKDLPIYELVVAGGGAHLTPTPSSPPPPNAPSGKAMVSVRASSKDGNADFKLTNASTLVLADLLSRQIHRQIVDKTGITGQYDIAIHWPQSPDLGDAVATAIEDQLGLSLRAAQGPVPVLTVNQVERPSEE
jgi:bla regulator protein BlaR1